jgi:hypothetical protein
MENIKRKYELDEELITKWDMSLKAKGLYLLILHLKNNTDVKVTTRCFLDYGLDGMTAIKSAIEELKEGGYLEIKQSFGEHGIYTYEWELK